MALGINDSNFSSFFIQHIEVNLINRFLSIPQYSERFPQSLVRFSVAHIVTVERHVHV